MTDESTPERDRDAATGGSQPGPAQGSAGAFLDGDRPPASERAGEPPRSEPAGGTPFLTGLTREQLLRFYADRARGKGDDREAAPPSSPGWAGSADVSADHVEPRPPHGDGPPPDVFKALALGSVEGAFRFWGRVAYAWAEGLRAMADEFTYGASDRRGARPRAQATDAGDLLRQLSHLPEHEIQRLRRELLDALRPLEEKGEFWRRWSAKP